MNRSLAVPLAVIVALLAITGAVQCADYDIVYLDGTRTTDWSADAGILNFANYTGANAYGGAGNCVSTGSGSGTKNNGYMTLLTTTGFVATNQCYVQIWYHVVTASATAATHHVGLEYNGTDVETYTSASVEALDTDGFLSGWVNPVAGGVLRVHVVTSVNKAVTYFIDEIKISFSSTPSYTTTVQLYDEATSAHLATFSDFTVTPYELTSGDNAACSILTDVFDCYSFGYDLSKLSISYGGLTRDYYLDESTTNNLLVSMAASDYTVAIIDYSETYGASSHVEFIKEISGVNMTADEKILSWSKVCYSPLVTGQSYVITVTSPTGMIHVAGNLSITDNPVYILISTSSTDTTVNVTVPVIKWPTIQNASVSLNWTTTFALGWMGTAVTHIYSSPDYVDWGIYILTAIPLLFVMAAGKHYLSVMVAAACIFMGGINLVIGVPVFSWAVLGVIVFVEILIVFTENRGGIFA